MSDDAPGPGIVSSNVAAASRGNTNFAGSNMAGSNLAGSNLAAASPAGYNRVTPDAGPDSLTIFLRQWGHHLELLFMAATLVLLPICLPLGFCAWAGLEEIPSGAQDLHFSLKVLVAAAFMSSFAASFAVRILLGLGIRLRERRRFRKPGSAIPVNSLQMRAWFSPYDALRDLSSVAGLFTLLAALPLSLLAELGIGEEAGPEGWILSHLWIAAAGALSIYVPTRYRWLRPRDALLPGSAILSSFQKLVASWPYAVGILAAYLLIYPLMDWLAHQRPGILFVLGPLLILALSAAGSLVINRWMCREKSLSTPPGALVRPKEPASVTIALIGPSHVGKTVFLARAYKLLAKLRHAGFALEPTPESRAAVDAINLAMDGFTPDGREVEREWPLPTTRPSDIPFQLSAGLRSVVQFNWLDIPGGAFTNAFDDVYQEAASRFQAQLYKADAVVMLFDAEDVARLTPHQRLEDVPGGHVYYDVARDLFKHLQESGETARRIPLVLIMAKSCRLEQGKRPGCEAMIKQLAHRWAELAEDVDQDCPPWAFFASSAVLTPPVPDEDDPNPLPTHDEAPALQSEQCLEPILWLTAQVMRLNRSVRDALESLHSGPQLEPTILLLEDLAKNGTCPRE